MEICYVKNQSAVWGTANQRLDVLRSVRGYAVDHRAAAGADLRAETRGKEAESNKFA